MVVLRIAEASKDVACMIGVRIPIDVTWIVSHDPTILPGVKRRAVQQMSLTSQAYRANPRAEIGSRTKYILSTPRDCTNCYSCRSVRPQSMANSRPPSDCSNHPQVYLFSLRIHPPVHIALQTTMTARGEHPNT